MEIINDRIERPWQGTVLGIFQIIQIVGGIIASFVLSIGLIIGSAFIETFVEHIPFELAVGASVIAIIFRVFIIPFTVFGIFLAIGLFKGCIWTVIVSMIFAVLGIIGNIPSFNFFGLAFAGFSLYCCIECIKHPYYRR